MPVIPGKQVAYRYKDASFSINNKAMSALEESELKEVLITMRRIKGLLHCRILSFYQHKATSWFAESIIEK